MKRIQIFSLILIFSIFCFPKILYGQSSSATTEIEQIRQEIAKLKKENDQLRQENQTLRKMLAGTDATPATSKTETTTTPSTSTTNNVSAATTNNNETGYWLTTSSSKRHNSKCRYYKNSNGRPCGPSDGIACKICGG